MRLCLSSDALPGGTLADLGRAARRRALAGLELTLGAGHAHGLAGLAEAPDAGDAPVLWLRLPARAAAATVEAWAERAAGWGAGLLLAEPVADPPPGAALVHGTDPAAARAAAGWARRHGAGTCWQVAPGDAGSAEAGAVLEATGPTLAHVRLLGAGPEAEAPGAAGTGPLLGLLALHGYAGTVAIAPSPGADLAAWERWLFRTRGWGCGTAAEKQARALARKPA